MEKKKIWKEERFQVLVLVLAAFLLLTAWAFMQPLGAGPDEKMRYMVAQYLHEHPGKLPRPSPPAKRPNEDQSRGQDSAPPVSMERSSK